MVMFTNPFGMVVVPPTAVVPHMRFVVVAVVGPPLWICLNPFRMMRVNPARMVVMPPVRVVPLVMFVPVTVVVLGMCNHRRSREQCRHGCGGENRSKFHSDTS